MDPLLLSQAAEPFPRALAVGIGLTGTSTLYIKGMPSWPAVPGAIPRLLKDPCGASRMGEGSPTGGLPRPRARTGVDQAGPSAKARPDGAVSDGWPRKPGWPSPMPGAGDRAGARASSRWDRMEPSKAPPGPGTAVAVTVVLWLCADSPGLQALTCAGGGIPAVAVDPPRHPTVKPGPPKRDKVALGAVEPAP